MFCADSNKELGDEEGSTISDNNISTDHDHNCIIDDSTMENDLIRNITLTAINHPSRSRSILMSLVDDLSFWDIDESSRSGNNKEGTCNRHNDRNQNSLTKKNRSSIPSMQEAMMLDERGGGAFRRDLNDWLQSDDGRGPSPPAGTTSWKSAVDPSTGKTYYYDSITRKTQWDKPAELKALERMKKQERKRRDRKFFEEMERNVVNSLARGEVIPGIPLKETKKEGPPQEPHPRSRVRTISGMDDMLLAELRDDYNVRRQDQHQRQPFPASRTGLSTKTTPDFQSIPAPVQISSSFEGRPPLPLSRLKQHPAVVENSDDDDMDLSPDMEEKGKLPMPKPDLELAGEKFLDAPIHDEWSGLEKHMMGVSKQSSSGLHARRNTGGTIYLQNTMTNPDIKATIKCVCGVYRAHIVQATTNEAKRQRSAASREFAVFNDDFGSSSRRNVVTTPSLSDVLEFYEAFYLRSQMEHDTIITALIYVERVIKFTDGRLTPNPDNWRSLLFACMVLASKVWDDLSMWNVDFSNVTAHTAGLSSFTLRRINQLELALLKCLKFDVKVPASEYAKYYFLIRTMLLRSGLVKEDEKPLGKRDAFQKLESLTNTFLDSSRDRRTKSMDFTISKPTGKDSLGPGPVLKDSVCLEQLVG